MGAWVGRVPKVPEDGWRSRRVAFLGHLVQRQGVSLLLDALALLRERGVAVSAMVIGGGPLEQELRETSRALGLADTVTFHGFVEDHRDVESLLAQASLAVAPYEPTLDSFTRYADPGKLKAYLAAGLPILLTDVPPNARELAENAGAEIVPFDAAALARAIEDGLANRSQWQSRREAALAYARGFDWSTVLSTGVSLGRFEPLTPRHMARAYTSPKRRESSRPLSRSTISARSTHRGSAISMVSSRE